jgi:hypothetical protein
MQLSTVLSDSFVAASALFALKNVFANKKSVHFLIKISSFLLILIAACTGILRFSFFPQLAVTHEALSAIASHIGMVVLFILFFSLFIKPFEHVLYLLPILIFLSAISFYFGYEILYTKISGSIAIVGIMGVCISKIKVKRDAALLGISACIFSMIAGAFQEFKISFGPFLDIDLFHYAFSMACVLWGYSLKKAIA